MNKQEEDRGNGDGHNHHQMVQGTLHVVKLAAPLDVIARRAADTWLFHLLLQLLHVSAQVAVLHVDADDNAALAHVAIDERGPFDHLHAATDL